MVAVDPELVDIALERISGTTFESFSNTFFPSLLGVDYSPLGGMHDGGADAFGGDIVHERNGKASVFYQASVQSDPKAKIRATIRRLREYGRQPEQLHYLTSRTVSSIDVVEDTLSEELDVSIRIRDARYIRAHINDSSATEFAFERHLRPETLFLAAAGSAPIIPGSAHASSTAVFVFLRQTIDRLDGNVSLLNSVTDSLALWALEGTDPDAGLKMSADDVLDKIRAVVPSAASLIERRLHDRLVELAKKGYPGGRKVNWHRKEDRFVLPLSTRESIGSQNRDDEALRIRTLQAIERRAEAHIDDLADGDLTQVARVSLRALQLAFEQEGLEFAHYITRSSDGKGYPQISDAVRAAVEESGVYGAASVVLASRCLKVARDCLYHSSDDERDYLGRLARTYTLLFTLNNEPRVLDYFEGMASNFELLVGSDLLVRALSERYLEEPSQLIRNTLTMATRAGASLILTEPVLDEVLGNLRSSDREYENYIKGVEHRMSADLITEVPKILVRAYLYNRQIPAGPTNWPAFVEQFCSHADLHRPAAREQLRRYFRSAFAMTYVSREQLEELANPDEVDLLSGKLASVKENFDLARNDALLACAVYGNRLKRNESGTDIEFGYRTWWLTNEARILRSSRELVSKYDGARYMMRPDFLLNFLAFAPQATEVRQSFANIFPSTLGVQMSRRMDERTFHDIMRQIKEAEQYDDGRRMAIMAGCADKLKSDFERRYAFELDEPGKDVALTTGDTAS